MEIYYNILLPLQFDRSFTYKANGLELKKGDIVKVQFRKSEFWALVTSLASIEEGFQIDKIKPILAKHSIISFSDNLIEFIDRISAYNLAPKGLVLKAFIGILNADKIKNKEKATKELVQTIDITKFKLKNLSQAQQEIAQKIIDSKQEDNLKVSLLDAVTGAGKTEIYFSIIAKILQNKDEQVLILLPEIALTSQLLIRFEEQFGFKPALWHSKITTKEKREIFYGLLNSSVRVLIGARSALLLPFKSLKLVIIDEEHDSSYKQDEIFNFNARDMAVLKASIENFPVILSSATPSLESYFNAKNGKYNYFSLTDRYHKKNNNVNVIDLRQTKLEKNCHISLELRQALVENLEQKHQSLLFLNRRGYSPVTLCKACGHKVNCYNCSAYLVHHKGAKTSVCHYCGHVENFSHDCKICGEKNTIINIGAGVEKIKEEIESLIPHAKIAIVTSDNISNFKEAQKLVEQILNNEIDIIIGTQIIAKGYDFPNLTLVGVVDADSGFYSSELKSSEKSFQLLSQVIGRAGRRSIGGKVYIQSYNPQNFIFEKIIQNDKKGFIEFEMNNRKALNLPPFTKMAAFTISDYDENKAQNFAKLIVKTIPFNNGVEVLGPAPAPLFRLKNRYFYKIFLKVEKKINLQKLISDLMNQIEPSSNMRVKIDIDP